MHTPHGLAEIFFLPFLWTVFSERINKQWYTCILNSVVIFNTGLRRWRGKETIEAQSSLSCHTGIVACGSNTKNEEKANKLISLSL